jgi:hypothetical protein
VKQFSYLGTSNLSCTNLTTGGTTPYAKTFGYNCVNKSDTNIKMTMRNKLDKAFGPFGNSAGLFLFVAGLTITYFSLTGLILVLIGAFIGFTSTSTLVDFDKRRIKFSNNIFGIIPIGQWIIIQTDMKIGIKKSNKAWRAYSRSNRILDIANNDYRLILYDSNGREIMPIQKSYNLDSAKLNLDKISKELEIEVI